MTIELNPEQQKVYTNLVKLACEIEGAMAIVVVSDEPAQIKCAIDNRLPYLANLPKMMEGAVAIHDWAKGEVAKEMIADNRLYEAKQAIQLRYIEGRIAKYSALYERINSLHSALKLSIEGLRSLLSYEKQFSFQPQK